MPRRAARRRRRLRQPTISDDLARAIVRALHLARRESIFSTSSTIHGWKMGEYFLTWWPMQPDPARPLRVVRAAADRLISPAMLSFMDESRQLDNRRMHRELRLQFAPSTVASGPGGIQAGRVTHRGAAQIRCGGSPARHHKRGRYRRSSPDRYHAPAPARRRARRAAGLPAVGHPGPSSATSRCSIGIARQRHPHPLDGTTLQALSSRLPSNSIQVAFVRFSTAPHRRRYPVATFSA